MRDHVKSFLRSVMAVGGIGGGRGRYPVLISRRDHWRKTTLTAASASQILAASTVLQMVLFFIGKILIF